MYCEDVYRLNLKSDCGESVNQLPWNLSGRLTENFGSGSMSIKQLLVLDGEKGELVKTSGRLGKKNGVSEAKTLAALKNHSEAERRRRERINAHFATLRGLVPSNEKVMHIVKVNTTQGNLASPRGIVNMEDKPDHLLVLVHGILASPSDWTYFEAELKRRLGKKFLIYASSCNTYTKTFTGIEGAGKRLADEVTHVVKKTESLKKISFLAHSLGGLFARYAVAVLYTPSLSSDQSYDMAGSSSTDFKTSRGSNRGLIAGLEAINFITLATPHLGVRGNKQLPFLLGVPFLEKLAAPIAPIFAGRTGSQLFLTDGKPNKPPLLLQMTSDCEEGKFISALAAFRCRVLYANVSYDHMVGWRTSSIRRETELVKPPSRSLDGYKHIVDVEHCPPVLSEVPNFPPEAAKAKEAAQNEPSAENTLEYHEIMEEEMIHGLQRIGWRKVDVSFHSAFWPFFAHNNIHVKNEWFHNAGAGVVAHVADTINQQEKQQDSSAYIAASL